MPLARPRVPFIAPEFPDPDEVAGDFRTIVSSNRFTNFGPFEQEFRAGLAAFVGPDAHVVTFCNATAALQAAATALFRPTADVPARGRGGPSSDARLVLMPSFTFAAAAQIALHAGLRPLFVDIEPDGLHADPSEARRVLERRAGDVAGILFANAFGAGAHHIADWEGLAEEHHLPLLVDSAAGFGSRYEDGSVLGLRGDCEVFSFHATKPMAIGEGGAVVTRDPALATRLRQMSNFGFDADGQPSDLGMNGKLAELPAAIGVRQLTRLDDVIAGRQKLFQEYRATVSGVTFPRNAERSSLAFVTALMPSPAVRGRVLRTLSERGIEARCYYSPTLHSSPLFAGKGLGLPVTEAVAERVISLPCHDGVSSGTVAEIAEIIAVEAQ